MQTVKSKLPSWGTTKTQSKKGFDKAWALLDKLGRPINRWTNKIGSEAFWPTTLDKESYKAARILRSFCKDGFYAEEDRPVTTEPAGPKKPPKVLKKIPQKVIENAVGLAIFTTMRTGLWISGAGGSGVLVARKEDGTWSPPSGIMLHTAGIGFLAGVDIYDCVLVINNRKALESFTKIRATLGGEISAVAGPVGVGGVLENDGKWKQANRPVFTYLKSRGLYAGVQVDGTVVIERTDENARFYGETIGVTDILAGKARHPPPEIQILMETLKSAEGKNDVDAALMDELDGLPAPGDVTIDDGGGHVFGIPEEDDPDPFGVHALEKEGLEVVEAGTHQRPSSEQFEYNPSPKSPIYNTFHRRSLDVAAGRNSTHSRKSSLTDTASMRRRTLSPGHQYTVSDAGTQTDDGAVATAGGVTRVRSRSDGFVRQSTQQPDQETLDESDELYVINSGEGDAFVNGYAYPYGDGNPWKYGDEGASTDSGVAIEHRAEAQHEETKVQRLDAGARALVPPPLPPRE